VNWLTTLVLVLAAVALLIWILANVDVDTAALLF
jgi:hypothetical protein